MLNIPGYDFLLRHSGDRERLVVVMSQDTKPVFERNDFGCLTLTVWEKPRQSYFVRGATAAVRQLCAHVLGGDVREVVFFGTSKGGFGALLWSIGVARVLRDVAVSAIAFSPQTELWPVNAALAFPSYQALVKQAETDSRLADDLRAHGTLPDPSALDNYRARIIFPERVETDAKEASRCRWANLQLEPLPISTHNTILPFTEDMADIEAVRRAGAALLRAADVNPDVDSFMANARMEELVAEYHALGTLPRLPELVQQTFASHPSRVSSQL